ncbi:MAG: DUF1294 domain-containing protein [Sulfurovum sp.]|nr:DUF1294 domain-containing protein [Sulfurovum sp.]
MLRKGILTKWNDDKGYGFITPVESKKSIFVHINEFEDRNIRPTINRAVIFNLSSKNGKPCAINVQIDDKSSLVRKKGILTKWNDNKGYGFITPVGESKEIFIHITEYQGRPLLDDKLFFTLSKDKNDKAIATNAIKFHKSKLTHTAKDTNTLSILSIFSITIFYLMLFYFIKEGILQIYIIPYYLIISIFTFFIYSQDKDYAQNGSWRVSENTLHLLSIFGGWSGALIAQNKLQHKSSKTGFQIIFYLTILLNLFLLFKFRKSFT